MTTMIGKFKEPICPVCLSENCIGKYDSLEPRPMSYCCPYDGPEDRAVSLATLTLYDLSYEVTAIKCSLCSNRSYSDFTFSPHSGVDTETLVNLDFEQRGWYIEDGQPVCPTCRGWNA